MTKAPKLPPPAPNARIISLLKLFIFMVAGGIGGWCFVQIGSPLPWMIGPLITTAVLSLSGLLPVRVPNRIRPFGQVVVASQIGLTFTPATAALLWSLMPVILATAFMTLFVILIVAFAFASWSRMTYAQSFLAAVPTSPIEAAAMAEDLGLDPAPVIFSQTLRLSAVVVVLPIMIYALEGWPQNRSLTASSADFDLLNILLLALIGYGAMRGFMALKIPNPNFLGPLTALSALAVLGIAPLPYPPEILAAAQIVLGCWLGSTFQRDHLAGAGRMLVTALTSILTLLALCSLGAALIAYAAGMEWTVFVLGAAPGGVTEMALTAKFLGQNVAIVTAFHLTRIFLFMPNTPWIVRLIAKFDQRSDKGQPL